MKRNFGMSLNQCIVSFEKWRKVIVMGDMNAKVGNENVDEVMGNGKYLDKMRLVDVCAERW